MARRLIGFDLDGVVIDSLECMERAWHLTCIETGVEVNFSSFRKRIGKPLGVILSELGINGALRENAKQRYISATKEYSFLIKVEDKIVDFIKSDKSMGIICAVITSKPRVRAKEILWKIGLKDTLLVCPEDTGRGKPHPDPLIYANRVSGVGKNNSVYIGDMQSDKDAALAAGWRFVYASWGYGELDKEGIVEGDRMASADELWKVLG